MISQIAFYVVFGASMFLVQLYMFKHFGPTDGLLAYVALLFVLGLFVLIRNYYD